MRSAGQDGGGQIDIGAGGPQVHLKPNQEYQIGNAISTEGGERLAGRVGKYLRD